MICLMMYYDKDAFLESVRLGSDLNPDGLIRRPVLREIKLPGNANLVPMSYDVL